MPKEFGLKTNLIVLVAFMQFYTFSTQASNCCENTLSGANIKVGQNRETKAALDPINFYHKMNFNIIKPGKFLMGDSDKAEVEITKPFEMMQTPMTQMMWARLKVAMGETDPENLTSDFFSSPNIINPTEQTDFTTVMIDGISVRIKPNFPANDISWDTVNYFIRDLNHLSKSDDPKVQEILVRVIPSHQKGDFYDLPTSAQWEFVMRNRGEANKKYFDRDDNSELGDYAWTYENSGGKLHPVATRKPRMIDDQPFYDLEGNVAEWVKDNLAEYRNFEFGGVDPQGPPGESNLKVTRGGSYAVDARLESGIGDFRNRNSRVGTVGFRLIRVRP